MEYQCFSLGYSANCHENAKNNAYCSSFPTFLIYVDIISVIINIDWFEFALYYCFNIIIILCFISYGICRL